MSTTAPGGELPTFTMTDIDLDRINEFMDLMGDTNPVHNDEALVEKLGLRGPVAQGPASLAYVINMLLEWQPDGMLERLSFRFRDVVTVGDEPTARGVVTRVEGGRAVIDVSLGLQTGTTAVRGTATVRLPEVN